MKPNLIILSDIWGREKSEWLSHYIKVLNGAFSIKYYDSCELGNVDKSVYTEKSLHQQFIDGGIDTAVLKLTSQVTDKIHVLGFSVGGVIAWRLGLLNPNISSIHAVSATRLRHEVTKPPGEIQLHYGEKDNFKPSEEWLIKMSINYSVHADKDHLFYRDPQTAEQVGQSVLSSTFE